MAPKGTFSDREIMSMIAQVAYSGNPVHKKHRGDFNLIPPAIHRPRKSLCDLSGIFRREQALSLLKRGLELGTVGKPGKDGWPKRIWAIAENGMLLEARSDAVGNYHGYPLMTENAFRKLVANILKGKWWPNSASISTGGLARRPTAFSIKRAPISASGWESDP